MLDTFKVLIQRYLSEHDFTKEELLWTALIVGLVLSGLQMLVMMTTQWGDRNATGKTLLFSLLVHFSFISGAYFLIPGEGTGTGSGIVQAAEQQPGIQGVSLASDELEGHSSQNQQPFWERITQAEDWEMARLERDDKLEPLEQELLRQKEQPFDHSRNPVSLPFLPAGESSQPVVETSENQLVASRTASVPDLKLLHDPQALSRKEYQLPGTPFQRREQQSKELSAKTVKRSERHNSSRIPFTELDPSKNLVTSASSTLTPKGRIHTSSEPNNLFQRSAEQEESIQNSFNSGLSKIVEQERTSESNTGTAASEYVKESPFQRRSISMNEPRKGFLPTPTFTPDQTQKSDSVLQSIPGFNFKDPSMAKLSSSATPQIKRPHFEPIRQSSSSEIPLNYTRRDPEKRKMVATTEGGSEASEVAVERALKWLVKAQHPKGYWDASEYDSGLVERDENGVNRLFAGKESDAGVTALALLTFLGAGSTYEKGPYQKEVIKAVDWLISQQTSEGHLGEGATHYAKMYCHGMATYALAEAYGMSENKGIGNPLRRPLEKAIRFIIERQNKTGGGWRYLPGMAGDMSMFGWQLMALRTAEHHGIAVPRSTNTLMVKFLKEQSRGDAEGLAAYRQGAKISPVMTSEALFCKQMFNMKSTHPASEEAVNYVLKHLPNRKEMNLYYWYYAQLALFHHGGKAWESWNPVLRDLLIEEQIAYGPQAGSWDPKGVWGRYGGRVYSTALSTLCLEVYYRFTPLSRDRNFSPK